jgi:hypothetical protein
MAKQQQETYPPTRIPFLSTALLAWSDQGFAQVNCTIALFHKKTATNKKNLPELFGSVVPD